MILICEFLCDLSATVSRLLFFECIFVKLLLHLIIVLILMHSVSFQCVCDNMTVLVLMSTPPAI